MKTFRFRNIMILGWLALLMFTPGLRSACAATADPNATPATKALYTYLQGLSSQPDHRLISGQTIWRRQGQFTMDYTPFQDVFNTTGQRIGAVALNGSQDGQQAFAIDHWNHGGIVQYNFLDGNNPYYWNNNSNNVDLTTLLTDPRYLADLDDTVTDLKVYQDAGVVILLRVYFEMNGEWNWFYGNHAAYIALWRHLFNYLTSYGVHNLLWVYCPASVSGDVMGYYPGDAYVDVVALDVYEDLNAPLAKASGYDELTATGKPFGLGEYGPSTTEGYNNGGLPVLPPTIKDMRYFLQGIKENMPLTTFWMQWVDPYNLA